MKNKMYELSSIPISDWKHGAEHSRQVDQLKIGDLLGTEFEDLIPPDTLDNLYYHLLDSKAIRRKLKNAN